MAWSPPCIEQEITFMLGVYSVLLKARAKPGHHLYKKANFTHVSQMFSSLAPMLNNNASIQKGQKLHNFSKSNKKKNPSNMKNISTHTICEDPVLAQSKWGIVFINYK